MGYSEIKKKAGEIQKNVQECSVIIGEKKGISVDGINVPTGLNENYFSDSLYAASQRMLNNGLFKILFMGTFKNGKSTTVNAMLGLDMLPVAATACTAVISNVRYGQDKTHVNIYFEGDSEPKQITMEEFLEEYKLSDEDIEKIETEGGTDRFSNIDHVVLESDLEIFKNGVEFIDSPGLAESVSRTKTTNKYIPQANAIVFLLNAVQPFTNDDKKFITKHFIDVEPKPKNVFFVMTKLDMLNTDRDRENVKKQAKNLLKPVFTENGIFDENIFSKRVFFVNGYQALVNMNKGLSAEGTGIPELKNAIEEFLTSDDMVVAKYKTTVGNMANIYTEVEENIKRNNVTRGLELETLEKGREEAEKSLQALEKDVERICNIIDNTKKVITDKILMNLETFIKVDLARNWNSALNSNDIDLRVLDFMKLAVPFVSKETKAEILDPMVDFVNNYVTEQFDNWTDSLPMLVEENVQYLQSELNNRTANFDLEMNKIRQTFSGGATTDNWNNGGANKLQLALSLMQGDISVAVENNVSGNFSWMEFIKRYAFQYGINLAIYTLIGAGIPGFIAGCIIETIQLILRKNKSKDAILNNLAQTLFEKLYNRMDDSEKGTHTSEDIRKSIDKQFDIQKENIKKAALSVIEDERQQQNQIIEQVKSGKDEIEYEANREKVLLNEFYNRIDQVYYILFDKHIENIEQVANIIGIANN